MPDPADKSDDLISELAKLMATPPQPAPAAQPLRPVPFEPVPGPTQASAGPAPAPIPVVRIPGMDFTRPVAAPAPAPVVIPASAMATPQPEQRAPLTGAIRIPGMDQPIAASAPVGKLDLGRPPQATTRPEPNLGGSIPSLSERIAARAAEAESQRIAPAPAPVAPPIRFPELRTVSENRSFAQGPSVIPVMPPLAPAPAPQQPMQSGDFSFDFGFGAQASAAAPASAPAPGPAPSSDPIADLINADMHATPARPAPVIPVLRTAAPPRPATAAPPAAARPMTSAPIPLKPVAAAPRPTEGDRFAAAPSAGLNMRAQAVARPLNRPVQTPRQAEPEPEILDDADPMAEIESLIGEAVRVELNPGPVRVQAATPVAAKVEFEPESEVRQEIHSEPPPVVPPLNTQFVPRRAGLRDEGHAAAEDAILQASAASGAPVGRVEPAMADEGNYRRLKVRPQRSSMSSGVRQYVGMAVAGTLLLAAGLGLYWVLNMGRAQDLSGANAPQLTADATPVKAKPDPAAKPVTDAANSPVLKQMEGVSQAPSAEQLVTTDQTAGQTNVADANAPAADTGENGLANRKVRTVTVRPDGTIVPGDDAVAGNEALAVDRPNVPVVPGSAPTDTGSTTIAPTAALPSGLGPPPGMIPDDQASAAADAAASVADIQPVIDPNQVAPVPLSFPVHGVSANAPLALASTPKSSVNAVVGTPVNLLPDNSALQSPPASTAPVAAAPATTDATAAPVDQTAGGAAAYVQIASSTSASDASAAVKAATAKYGAIFGGNKLIVQQADLGAGKGVRWRVRLPVASFSDATNVCAQIKAQGGDCFPTNG